MTQFARALAAAVFGLLLGLVTPLAAAAAPALPSPSYDYYGAEVINAAPPTTTERGPPAHVQGDLTCDPDGLRLLGSSTRPNAPTTRTAYNYDDLTRLVQSAGGGRTVQERSDGPAVGPFVVQGSGVAANAGRTGARTCLRSFAGTTLVLMADGTRKAIEDVEVGDRVVATDPETGERVTRKVTHVWVHGDQVLDLVAEGEIITTTEDHLFWSVTDQRFERADQLAAGEVVLGDSGRQVIVSGLRLGTARTALAYNLSIVGVHTYHVGQNSILVHNTCPHTPDFGDPSKSPGDGWEWRGPDAPGGSRGAWYNAETRETLHPDLDHPEPIGPHYDWRDPDGVFWRVYPDGTTVPK